MSSNRNILNISLLGLRNTDKAALEFFLHKYCSSICRVVTDERADLCILDLDGISGKKLLLQQQGNYPHRQLIALSARDTDINGAHFLRKPLRSTLLQQAIEVCHVEKSQQSQAREDSRTKQPTPEPQQPAVPTPHETPHETPENIQQRRQPQPSVGFAVNNPRTSLDSLEASRRTVQECFGLPYEIDLIKQTDQEKLFYDPSVLFQGVLKRAIERSRQLASPIALQLPVGKHILLLPKANLALTDLSDARLRPRCLLPASQDENQIEHLDYSESHLLRTKNYTPQNIDSLLWKVALWSARGRLPVGTDIDAQVGLQHWPNVTRLLTMPQFLRIAALWVRRPQSLAATVDMLSIEARYVCAFFSACQALNLTWIQAAAGNSDMESAIVDAPTPARTGLLRRLLRHLRVS
jgi:hypothetical protein